MSALSFDGKVAVVTGSGRGLGRAYAVALAGAGAGVVVNDLDEAAAAETLALITDAGGRAVTEIAAVGEADSAQALVDRAKSEFGRLDVMVTNAGLLRDKVLWNMTDEDFDLVIRTHLRGTFTCARAAAIRMREQGEGGRIIVVGSPAGQFAAFGQTNYSAAKAGIVAFARNWSLELARAHITVNAIIPVAWTQMVATIPTFAPVAELLERGHSLPEPIRREHAIGMPEDCAPSGGVPRLRRGGRRSPGRRSASVATGSPSTRTRRRSPRPTGTAAGTPSRSRPSGRQTSPRSSRPRPLPRPR